MPGRPERRSGTLALSIWALIVTVAFKYDRLLVSTAIVQFLNLPGNTVVELGTQIEL